MSIFSKLFGNSPNKAQAPLNTVTFDESSVKRVMQDGRIEEIAWAELEEVCIITTDGGPAVDDVFYVLTGNGRGCAVPSEAVGMQALLPRLQALPNFNNEMAIKAMSSTSNAKFVCWQRQN
jgi:hypothetical protein